MVKFLLKALEQHGCYFQRQHVICEPCLTPVAGEFDPQRGIIMCQNHLTEQGPINDTLSHELIHAFDHCRASVQWTDCRHHACAEVSSIF
jgi:inner membrane protease ATP23